MEINQLTEKVIGLAIKVHRTLGPGFLESVYKAALAHELRQAGIPFEQEKEMPLPYGPIILEVGFRCDFLIDGQLIVECKAAKKLHPIDHAQTLHVASTLIPSLKKEAPIFRAAPTGPLLLGSVPAEA